MILDGFHTLGRKLDLETIRRNPGARIFFGQMYHAPMIEMDLLYWSRHFRNMSGEGDLDGRAFMRAVMATGYRGPVNLKIFNDQFRAGGPRRAPLAGTPTRPGAARGAGGRDGPAHDPRPDRRRTIRTIPLQQPEDLAPGQPQQVRAVLDIDPTVIDLRQNLDALQLALAHQNPSHARSLCLCLVQARVTLLHCSWVTL